MCGEMINQICGEMINQICTEMIENLEWSYSRLNNFELFNIF